MPSKPSESLSVRQQTDKSLKDERKKTDEEFGKRTVQIEEGSDAVVKRARGRADTVLEEARERADDTLEQAGGSSGQRHAVIEERAQEDVELHKERQLAEKELKEERLERVVALRRLLRLERQETDERLLVERARGDADLAARQDFIGMVNHDLRTLLGGIALSASHITSATDEAAGARNLKAAERIKRFTARINRLVGDLLDVASIEGGQFSIAPKMEDVRGPMLDSFEAFQPTASSKNISLTLVPEDGPLMAHFDHDRIFQVLANLLSNAIKFTGNGGKVSLAAKSLGGEVRFSVTDNGPGIASNQLQSVFERFWQVTKDDRRGLGLGLFISKCIVEAHGGRIWVESVMGEGSTFFFTLPAVAQSKA